MSGKRLVTFDMDGVLCRPPLGINPGSGRGKRRDTPGRRNLLWATERWRYHLRRPMPGAVEGLRAIAAEFEIAVVTARGAAAEAMTRAWLKRRFGVEPRLVVRPSWRETSAQYKARLLRELQPVAHFEDDPFTAAWAAELVPHVFLADWPRNRALAGTNITRIKTIGEALPMLRTLP